MLNKGIEKISDYLELYLTLASLLKDTERANESIQVLKRHYRKKTHTWKRWN